MTVPNYKKRKRILQDYGKFVCLFVTEATYLCVKTGSEQGSYANPLCQVTAVTAESFAGPVLQGDYY